MTLTVFLEILIWLSDTRYMRLFKHPATNVLGHSVLTFPTTINIKILALMGHEMLCWWVFETFCWGFRKPRRSYVLGSWSCKSNSFFTSAFVAILRTAVIDMDSKNVSFGGRIRKDSKMTCLLWAYFKSIFAAISSVTSFWMFGFRQFSSSHWYRGVTLDSKLNWERKCSFTGARSTVGFRLENDAFSSL